MTKFVRTRRVIAAYLCASLGVASAACSSATEPEVPAVVGEFCAASSQWVLVTEGIYASVVRDERGATVSLRLNHVEYQTIRRSDGVLVRQEQRSCVPGPTCVYPRATPTATARDLGIVCMAGISDAP